MEVIDLKGINFKKQRGNYKKRFFNYFQRQFDRMQKKQLKRKCFEQWISRYMERKDLNQKIIQVQCLRSDNLLFEFIKNLQYLTGIKNNRKLIKQHRRQLKISNAWTKLKINNQKVQSTNNLEQMGKKFTYKNKLKRFFQRLKKKREKKQRIQKLQNIIQTKRQTKQVKQSLMKLSQRTKYKKKIKKAQKYFNNQLVNKAWGQMKYQVKTTLENYNIAKVHYSKKQQIERLYIYSQWKGFVAQITQKRQDKIEIIEYKRLQKQFQRFIMKGRDGIILSNNQKILNEKVYNHIRFLKLKHALPHFKIIGQRLKVDKHMQQIALNHWYKNKIRKCFDLIRNFTKKKRVKRIQEVQAISLRQEHMLKILFQNMITKGLVFSQMDQEMRININLEKEKKRQKLIIKYGKRWLIFAKKRKQMHQNKNTPLQQSKQNFLSSKRKIFPYQQNFNTLKQQQNQTTKYNFQKLYQPQIEKENVNKQIGKAEDKNKQYLSQKEQNAFTWLESKFRNKSRRKAKILNSNYSMTASTKSYSEKEEKQRARKQNQERQIPNNQFPSHQQQQQNFQVQPQTKSQFNQHQCPFSPILPNQNDRFLQQEMIKYQPPEEFIMPVEQPIETLEMKVQRAQEYIEDIKKEKKLYKIALENFKNSSKKNKTMGIVDSEYLVQVKNSILTKKLELKELLSDIQENQISINLQ